MEQKDSSSTITLFVGIDDHQDTLVVAALGRGARRPERWEVANEGRSIRGLCRKLEQMALGQRVLCCYEAGCNGFVLQRQLRAGGVECKVVAPSLTPRRPGQRIKTDRRDAGKLAEYLRAGLLIEVHPPSEEQEAVRDLCRARDQARRDLTRCRQRVNRLLQRRGVRYPGAGRRWTKQHREWLWSIRLEHEADQWVLEDLFLALEQHQQRLARLEAQITGLAEQTPYQDPVGWLRCFRGIDTVTAMTLVSELHDIWRFQTPRELMAYLGLVPAEHSSGASERRGGITKSGNSHVRRVLVEAAWHYRHRPAISKLLLRRQAGQPAEMIALAQRAQERLNHRYFHLLLHSKKHHNQVIVAVARELVGFVWAALQGPASLATEAVPN